MVLNVNNVRILIRLFAGLLIVIVAAYSFLVMTISLDDLLKTYVAIFGGNIVAESAAVWYSKRINGGE